MGVSTDALDASAPAWTAESEGIAVPCMCLTISGKRTILRRDVFQFFSRPLMWPGTPFDID